MDNTSNCKTFFNKKKEAIYDIEKNISFDDIYDILINIDPSKDKKYCVWIFNQYIRNQFTLDEAIDVKNDIKIFLKKFPKEILQKNTYKDIKKKIIEDMIEDKDNFSKKNKCTKHYTININKKENKNNLSYEEIYEKLIEIDNTTNKKYCIWIIDQYINGEFELDDIEEFKDNLKFYLRVQEKKNVPLLDNDYTYSQLISDINIWKKIKFSNIIVEKEGEEGIILYDDVYGRLVSPLTMKGSCVYGSGTKWCTSSENNNQFNNYNKLGPLFIWKDGKTKNKYQFHFETGQFMDEKDNPINNKKLKCFIEDDPVIKELFILKKDIIISSPQSAYEYSLATGKRLLEAEKNIINSDFITVKINYAKNIIGGRWSSLENSILRNKDIYTGIRYVNLIIKKRWTELEDLIIKNEDITNGIKYIDVIKKEWTELEDLILINEDITNGVNYSIIFNKEWTELEDLIIKNEDILNGITYADEIIKNRWSDLENLILKNKDIDYGIKYLDKIIKKRWTELEDLILINEDITNGVNYSIILNKEWTELEDLIIKNKDINNGIIYQREIKEWWPEFQSMSLSSFF